MHSFISVILCTYNRAALLKRALRSFTQQSLAAKQFELLVVDDGSWDDTDKVCGQMFRELPNLKYMSTGANVGLSQARNIGIRAAAGDRILFTDDDCIPQKNWVEVMEAALEENAIVAGAVASPVTNYVKLCHNIAEFYEFMPHVRDGPKEYVAGANMGFRLSVLKELKDFDPYLPKAGDMEFILRARAAGYCVYFEPRAIVTHDPDRTTLASIFKYSAAHAATTILIRHQYRELLRTPFILHFPSLLLALAPLIALKVTCGIYRGHPGIRKFFWTVPVVYALKLAWCWGAAHSLRKRNINTRPITRSTPIRD